MLWTNEGFVLDDAGNVLTTSYIDLRDEAERTVIRSLVRGCRREHALEDGETLLISKPERFREYGVALIRDKQEGFAREEHVAVQAETPQEAANRRATTDLNDALQLVGSAMKPVHRVKHSRRKTRTESLTYGKDWWVFCASIRPDEAEWDAWRASLDDDPCRRSGSREVCPSAGENGDRAGRSARNRCMVNRDKRRGGGGANEAQEPVGHSWAGRLHLDRLYDMLTGEEDEVRRMAACLFAKPMTHAAQREYRFVVLNGGVTEETVQLKISGMMRDALTQTEGGLIRPSPAPEETVGDDGAQLPRPVKGSTTEHFRRATVKERKEEREETRLETRNSDGLVVSSDIKRRETVEEKVATKDLETDGRGIGDLRRAERREDAGSERPVLELEQGTEERSDADEEDAVAKEIARDERDWNDERGRDEIVIPVVHRGSGRTYKSFEEMFNDPSAPMSPATKTWEVSACSPQEIVKSYGAVATLAMKITRIAVEHRQEAASACWHALQCINNIYARLGDIVECVWIERDRFVVIHIRDSEELKATGRIVIGPSGGYAYCFKSSKSEDLGYSGGVLGKLFFPLGNDVETFESFGWPGKPRDTLPVDDVSS